jgi:hypothetical protein
MQIFVKANKTYVIDENINTVNDVKEAIHKKLDLKTNNYYLVANGKILDNNKNISDYKIDNYTTIYINFRPTLILDDSVVQFFVKLDKWHVIIMSKYDKVYDLKDLINKKFNFKNSKYYYLVFNAKILEDNKTLEECNLQNDSNVNICTRSNFILY